jgi:hypothetical protein
VTGILDGVAGDSFKEIAETYAVHAQQGMAGSGALTYSVDACLGLAGL